jgi:hypothetical protein
MAFPDDVSIQRVSPERCFENPDDVLGVKLFTAELQGYISLGYCGYIGKLLWIHQTVVVFTDAVIEPDREGIASGFHEVVVQCPDFGDEEISRDGLG